MKLNTFHLKIIATVLMIIDHIAYTCIPSNMELYAIMRIVGRVSAPLFWFCFVEGYKHTSNKMKYTTRLMFAALIMMVGNFTLSCFISNKYTLNIASPNLFLTMFFMLLSLLCFDQIPKQQSAHKVIYFLIGLIFALIVGIACDYGWIAACSILVLYFVKNNTIQLILFAIANTIIPLIQANPIQFFAVLSVLFIMNYDDVKPKRSVKWFFYWFYPIHLWALMIIGYFVV